MTVYVLRMNLEENLELRVRSCHTVTEVAPRSQGYNKPEP